MEPRSLHDGRQDGLTPLRSLDLNAVSSFDELLDAMATTAFGGRQLGEAFDILTEMASRPQCHVVLTLSGAMTVAKQGQIICELIDRGIVKTVVATGALIAHGVTEAIGLTHYRYEPSVDDRSLFEKGYNRIYDTLEMEANLNDVERVVCEVLDQVIPSDGVWSSAQLCHQLGQKLEEQDEGPGILRSAYQHDVPVFIPAFTDSELGLDFSCWAMHRTVPTGESRAKLTPDELFHAVPSYNPFLDLQQYARQIGAQEELGIVTIGGGVPRNWAQQVAPYYDITNHRLKTNLTVPRFRYGVRICPEPTHWGGLSGCTYSEGVSWGKFVSPSDGGRYAEVYADATVALPLLIKGLFERLARD